MRHPTPDGAELRRLICTNAATPAGYAAADAKPLTAYPMTTKVCARAVHRRLTFQTVAQPVLEFEDIAA